MLRKALLLLGAGVLIVLAINGVSGNREQIARAQAHAAGLAHQRDSLVTLVRRREEEQAALTIRIETQQAETDRLRDSVIALERRRAAAQLSVREIRTTGELQDRMRSAFPELGDSAWGLTTVPLDRHDTIGIEYLMVPAWFAETFVIDHANAQSWREQKDQPLAVDSLRLLVTALQDSVTRLIAANSDAYRTGYQAAYAGYQDLSRRHVAELRKPRIRLGSALGLLGAAGVGVVVWRVIP